MCNYRWNFERWNLIRSSWTCWFQCTFYKMWSCTESFLFCQLCCNRLLVQHRGGMGFGEQYTHNLPLSALDHQLKNSFVFKQKHGALKKLELLSGYTFYISILLITLKKNKTSFKAWAIFCIRNPHKLSRIIL